jgi:hypothetical protein
MLKIKLFAIACVLSLAALVPNISPVFVSKAEDDNILREIAGYRSWTKITKEPLGFQLKIASGEFQVDNASGSE